MSAVSIAGWGLVGIALASALRIAILRSPSIAISGRPAPPILGEVLTAALFSLLAWRIGTEPDVLAYSWLAAAGVQLATVDWNSRTLPTKLIWSTGVVLVTLLGLAAVLNRDAYPLVRSAAGALALLMFYGVLYFLLPGHLGGGDLRLGGVLGIALGWVGWTAILMGTLLGWLAAAVALLALNVGRRSNARRDVPLGPFLITGALFVVLCVPAGG